MEHDEYERLVEYSEMTAFNFGSKEYQEVKRDYAECKEALSGFGKFFRNFANGFKVQAV